jgi:hypothetical protein
MKLFHIHIHSKPIVSSYVSFHTRDVVWECRCGQRKLVRESRAFGSSFSLDWTCSLNTIEMTQVLEKKESKFLLVQLDIKKKAQYSVRNS